jgi:transcriptional regulator with XRE-family HTH domain
MRSPLHNEKYVFLLEALQELRKRKGWNQRELAAALGIGQDIVSRCESGKRRVDVFELALWCQACGTTLEKFVKGLDIRIRSNQLPGLLRPDELDSGK